MPILLCPGCWISLLFLFLLWLVLWFFARVFKFEWAIKINDWCTKKMKTIFGALRGGKKEEESDDGPCRCEDCGCKSIEK